MKSINKKGSKQMEKYKFALIGCGSMMGRHLSEVNRIEGAEVVCVCDIVRENAEIAAEEIGGNPIIVEDYRKILDVVDIDAVFVALPHHLYFDCGMYFALNKKHILMEKTMCNTEAECIRLIETCDKMGVTLMCAYPNRYRPGMIKLKEMLESGEYGEIMQMSIWTEQLTGEQMSYIKGNCWSYDNRVGGGQLFAHGCHYIDVLLWFLGNPLWGAHMGTNNGTPWMLEEGTSAVVMKFENGAVAYHGATWGARGTRLGYDFQVQTEKGMLEYMRFEDEIRLYDENMAHVPGAMTEQKGKYKVLWKGEDENSKSTRYEIMHFIECVREGKEPMTSGKNALQSLRVIWALYNAEKNNMLADLRGLGFENQMK